MASKQSADDAKQQYVDAMGAELGPIYDALWQEVVWLHLKWHEYIELFGKKSRLGILNTAAPTFFRMLEDTLWDDILLHITRLTAHPKSAGKPNLTILRLAPLIDDMKASAAVSALVGEAVSASAFCLDWRNRRIAHQDLHLALGIAANPLDPASREKIDIALSAIDKVLNAVVMHYLNTANHFDWRGVEGGALDLLYVIDDGNRINSERHARLDRGQLVADDWHTRDL